jgi:hypothetical protein
MKANSSTINEQDEARLSTDDGAFCKGGTEISEPGR